MAVRSNLPVLALKVLTISRDPAALSRYSCAKEVSAFSSSTSASGRPSNSQAISNCSMPSARLKQFISLLSAFAPSDSKKMARASSIVDLP
ncbi:hypothetical protein D3C75_871160 [compost metagenome]